MLISGCYQLVKGFENNTMTVGFGSYGQVKLGKNIDTGQIVAIKIINKLAKNQVLYHNRLCHPKIIQLLSYQVDRERQKTYMVLEYADDGTLFEKIRAIQLPKNIIKQYFKDICEAVCYIHSKGIMHRDIKPENILLNKKKQAKLCDFGFAAILGERMTLCGTYEYMSPQMIQNKSYDQKIDIWALGILLFQMISGQAPFRGESPDEVLSEMKTKIFFNQKFDVEQIAMIKMILRVTPSKRPSIVQILSHPYFQEHGNSTRCSEEESKIKLLSIQKVEQQTNQVKMINPFYKVPQNSYPFYLQKPNVIKDHKQIHQKINNISMTNPSNSRYNGQFNNTNYISNTNNISMNSINSTNSTSHSLGNSINNNIGNSPPNSTTYPVKTQNKFNPHATFLKSNLPNKFI